MLVGGEGRKTDLNNSSLLFYPHLKKAFIISKLDILRLNIKGELKLIEEILNNKKFNVFMNRIK